MKFAMLDIIEALHLPYPPPGRASYNINCPNCDVPPHKPKKHLNINLQKDVFCCPKCGAKGGMFDLYALFTGIDRHQVIQVLTGSVQAPQRKWIIENTQTPMAEIDIRDTTYSALLQQLSLSDPHYANLRERGLSDAEIARLEYKSCSLSLDTAGICKTLLESGCTLAGVPGFYRNKDGNWNLWKKNGIMIPVRDLQGRIQGIQIRLDNSTKRKFRWLSSADKSDGCSAQGWCHIAGSAFSETVYITEGSMKADIIHFFVQKTILSVPGVNSLKNLSQVLRQLKQNGTQKIKIAFDMDFLTNPNVRFGLKNLHQIIISCGFPKPDVLVWDKAYKGLDDYLKFRFEAKNKN